MDTKSDKKSASVTEEKQKTDTKGQKKKWYDRIPVHPFDEEDDNLK